MEAPGGQKRPNAQRAKNLGSPGPFGVDRTLTEFDGTVDTHQTDRTRGLQPPSGPRFSGFRVLKHQPRTHTRWKPTHFWAKNAIRAITGCRRQVAVPAGAHRDRKAAVQLAPTRRPTLLWRQVATSWWRASGTNPGVKEGQNHRNSRCWGSFPALGSTFDVWVENATLGPKRRNNKTNFPGSGNNRRPNMTGW